MEILEEQDAKGKSFIRRLHGFIRKISPLMPAILRNLFRK
jgi:hypothetical protein